MNEQNQGFDTPREHTDSGADVDISRDGKGIPTDSEFARMIAAAHRVGETGILVLNDAARFVYANDQAEHLLRVSPETLLGRTAEEVFSQTIGSLREALTIEVPPVLRDGPWLEAQFIPFGHRDEHEDEGTLVFLRNVTERKRQQEQGSQTLVAARERDRRWTELANALPLMIWTTPPEGDVTTFHNQHFYAYTGLRRDIALGAIWKQVVHPEDLLELWITRRRALETQESWAHEYRVRRHDGVWRWHLGRTVPIRGVKGDVSGWVSFATDIHDLREAEAARRAADERLALAMDAAQMGTWDFDFATGLGWLSEQNLRLHGLPLDQPATPFELWKTAIHTEDRARVLAAFEDAVKHGAPYNVEYRTSAPGEDGQERWIASPGSITKDSQGRPLRALGTARDITAQKRAEARAQAAEERMVIALDASEAGVYEVDCATGNRQYSPRTFELLGLPPPSKFTRASAGGSIVFAPLDARDFWVCLNPADHQHVEEALAKAYDPDSGAAGIFEAEYRVPLANGEQRWLSSKGRVTFDSTGRFPVRLVGLLRDITDRKRVEAERAEIAAKKEQIAEAVQHSLLLMPPPDAYPGLTVVSQYRAVQNEALIGGDFCDVFAVSDGCIALLVGDAVGKGVRAATYTAEIKFALRAFLRECGGSPAQALTRLNAFVVENTRLNATHMNNTYTAAMLAILETRTGKVSLSTAGTEPPFIVCSPSSPTGETIKGTALGPLLGLENAGPYAEQEFVLGEDDLLVMTTDGILEARRSHSQEMAGDCESNAFFGVDRAAAAIRQEAVAVADLSNANALGQIGEAVIAKALAFADGKQHDDICLLLARRR